MAEEKGGRKLELEVSAMFYIAEVRVMMKRLSNSYHRRGSVTLWARVAASDIQDHFTNGRKDELSKLRTERILVRQLKTIKSVYWLKLTEVLGTKCCTCKFHLAFWRNV